MAATTGPDGILVESLGWETDAVLIRVAVRVLQETDDLVHGAFEAVDYLVGRSLGFTLVVSAPALLAAGLVAGPLAHVVWPHLPPALQQRLRHDAAGAGAGLQDWLGRNPGVVQHLVDGGGGLLDGLWDGLTPITPGGPFGIATFTPDTESAAGLLAGALRRRLAVRRAPDRPRTSPAATPSRAASPT